MNDLSTPVAPAPNYVAIKQRQQATWASGDYAIVGTTLQIVGESLAEAADVRADERVLDVAAGNGNVTLAAARRFARVTSTDYVLSLLDKGRERARAEGFDIRFQEADVEELPFPDASFDVVLSTFGAMFAPDQQRTADEMMRVLRSGGRLGMANWTPESFIGRLFKLIGRHVPPPAGVKSPALWKAVVEVFRDYYGPTHKAFAALDAAGRTALEHELVALLTELNVAGPASLVVPSEYLQVVISKA